MRTNSLVTGEGPMDAAAPVTPLKIAARGKEDPRAMREPDARPPAAPPATAAVIDDEVRRSHAAWRRTLDAVKETLATLERTCDAALETHDAGIEDLVDTLAGRAREDALAAAQQTRAQAEIEIAELRGALARHESDLQAARAALKNATDQLETERRARSQAERDRDAGQRTTEHLTAQLQTIRDDTAAQTAELARVRQHLEAETAERARLVSAFQAVQTALALAQPGHTAGAPLPPAASRPPDQGAHPVAAAPAPDPGEPHPAADPVVVIEPFPEVVEHAKRLLEQAEAMYWTDLQSGRPPLEVVDRLTEILRYSRELIVGRWGSDACDAAAVFSQQIGALLDAEAETSFRRHLSIAAFAARRSTPPVAS